MIVCINRLLVWIGLTEIQVSIEEHQSVFISSFFSYKEMGKALFDIFFMPVGVCFHMYDSKSKKQSERRFWKEEQRERFMRESSLFGILERVCVSQFCFLTAIAIAFLVSFHIWF